MEYKEIQNLIKLIDSSGLAEFKMKEGEFELLIRTKDYYKFGQSGFQTMPVSVGTAPLSSAQAQVPAPAQAAETPQSAPAVVETAPAGKTLLDIKSPIVGTFYRAPAPGKEPYIKIGDRIQAGAIVCIVEAMKLFNEIESEIGGTIVEILVDDSAPVEYDQVLFRVEP